VQQGWFDPSAGKPFDVSQIYMDDEARPARSELEQELKAAAPIDLRAMMNAVRDPRISKDSTGYGQVAQLKRNSRPDLNLLWVAPTGSITSPFIPYRIGIQSVPPQFGKHRYLTKGEASLYVTRDWQIQEATEFAGRTFKRLMYYTCDHPEKFLPEVTETLTAFENRLIAEQATVVETAETLFLADRPELASEYLTNYSEQAALAGLRLGNALLQSIEARTIELYGLRKPQTDIMSKLDYQAVTCQQRDAD
jgi:dipeptidase